MSVTFKLIPPNDILSIVPLLQELTEDSVSEESLKERVLEMAQQNYECIGVYVVNQLIGICGMWFQTRHYAGKSLEIDHVIVSESHRDRGIGKLLMTFIYSYARNKNCQWIELNTYVDNYASHRFYNNHGFEAKGYHFTKNFNRIDAESRRRD